VEVALALHGYSSVQRYLIEPAAVLIVVAGIGVGTALSYTGTAPRWLGIAAAAIVAVFVLSLAPYTRRTLRTDHALVSQAHHDALVLDRLQAVIADESGAQRVLACGRPVTTLRYQSTLAWELGVNVGTVDYALASAEAGNRPVVLFTPRASGWRVRAINPSAAGTTGCSRLDRSQPG
jgi:hypothetical protein